jgi:transposase
MTIEGATNGDVFRAYFEQVLGPTLRPEEVVVMDNLAAHKVAGIQEAIAQRGARVIYLPPYAPDLSPIEPCWSKLKTALRAAKARTYAALEVALVAALETVTVADARG